MIRPLSEAALSLSAVGEQWDLVADDRAAHFAAGIDLSMEQFIVPEVMTLFDGLEGSKVLDAGCGLGLLTQRLDLDGFDVTGIDVSRRSIELAREASSPDIQFVHASLEQLAADATDSFDIVVSNMSLMATPDLDAFVESAHALCRGPGARFVASLTHPAFWPRYWGYESDPGFEYRLELVVKEPFRISHAVSDVATTHIHRPLERYVSALVDAGFALLQLNEPVPDPELMSQYPEPWEFPRFLFMVAERL